MKISGEESHSGFIKLIAARRETSQWLETLLKRVMRGWRRLNENYSHRSFSFPIFDLEAKLRTVTNRLLSEIEEVTDSFFSSRYEDFTKRLVKVPQKDETSRCFINIQRSSCLCVETFFTIPPSLLAHRVGSLNCYSASDNPTPPNVN